MRGSRRLRAALVLLAWAIITMSLTTPAFAGRLLATGHDADLHCTGNQQCHYLNVAVSWVRAGAPDPSKPVLVLDHGANQVSTSLDLAFGAGVVPRTLMDPASPAFATLPLTVANYSAIVVASDSTCGGCDLNTGSSTADSDAINARAPDLAAFFNAGGGIVALAGASHGGATGTDNTYYKFVPLPLGGAAVSPPFTLTSVGTSIGLTDDPDTSKSDINCCATHNSFSLPPPGSALQVAETDSKGLAETLVAQGSISGGGIVPPGTGSLPPAFGPMGAIGIPSARKCLSRRAFTIHIRERRGLRYEQAIVFVNHRRVGVIHRRRFSAGVNLRGLPYGTFHVQITVIAVDGRIINGTRTYHTCRKKGPSHGPPRL